ncbi:cilia- and flagella-associated protein 418 isoform X3 [Dunckerocampus dactyliophorus]|uniref:cilia- and flagella-associated protein 418 isoform X3 n=1 Tax=Dunckerocampus dactyliophorus TaxID=161453 RepID=UPI0024073E43|nr:cilia- and flagella-associated protein 418 isoform X3 [Dunckerocampus dactyliophorus]
MDGDNLDELLDEVEKKFFRNVSVTDDCRASSKKDKKCGKDSDVRGEVGCTGHGGQRGSITDDIDALLEELKDEDHSDSPLAKHPKSRRAEQTPPCHSGGRKCCPVYLGGSAITNGVGTATSKSRSCDQLRCTSCDFRVLTFDGWEWDPSCDYLFLRWEQTPRRVTHIWGVVVHTQIIFLVELQIVPSAVSVQEQHARP